MMYTLSQVTADNGVYCFDVDGKRIPVEYALSTKTNDTDPDNIKVMKQLMHHAIFKFENINDTGRALPCYLTEFITFTDTAGGTRSIQVQTSLHRKLHPEMYKKPDLVDLEQLVAQEQITALVINGTRIPIESILSENKHEGGDDDYDDVKALRSSKNSKVFWYHCESYHNYITNQQIKFTDPRGTDRSIKVESRVNIVMG